MKIDIYCGPCWEPFTPASLEKGGIGGSETAVIHMAREMAALDHDVTVWTDTEGDFEYEGNMTKYRKWQDFHAAPIADVLVCWRNVAKLQGPRRCKVQVLWLHDLGLPRLPDNVCNNIDRVVVLSKFHGNSILQENPQLKNKLWYVGNGIDTSLYENVDSVTKNPNWFFYSSSPRRGLNKLLDEWPEVRKHFPEAVLHVAYGFDLTLQMEAKQDNHYAVRAYERMLERCRNTPGVVYHGRLSQAELAELQKQCIAWLYPPSDFEETFCITALEAQAAKCIPMSRSNGALPEVLNDYIIWESAPTYRMVAHATYKEYADPIATMLKANHEWAMSKSWKQRTHTWLEEFKKCYSQ